jgi:membrane protease YdiL (CAAX protease family)
MTTVGATRLEPDPIPVGRLVGWLALVGTLAALAYTANFAGDGETPDDLLYRWSSVVAALVQYGIVLAIVIALCRGIDRDLLGLRRPDSWPRALGVVVVAYIAIAIAAAVLNLVLQAGDEQGLVPRDWDSSRAAPFVANFLVVSIVAPIAEELTFRGLGLAVTTARWGVWPAVAVTSVAFGAAHGLVVALPILTLFGVVLALVRVRTASLYPAMVLHGVFNALALLLAVTVGV